MAAIVLVAVGVDAATFYTTPTGSGLANGTSYDNAWNGLDNVTGLASGDTVYVCGAHVAGSKDALLTSGVTVRMDYGPDPGSVSGGRFWLGDGSSNITFQTCRFYGAGESRFVTFTNNSYIVFTSCTFSNAAGDGLQLIGPMDHWSVLNCEFGDCGNGLYAHINSNPRGADYLMVSNCYFHDIDSTGYPNQDGHAIGLQGTSYATIISNRTERTGAAIEFWTETTIGLSNNVVAWNYIKDVHVCNVTLGNGIGFSADADGLATSNQVYGNIIQNVGINATDNTMGYGVTANRGDYIEVFNNTISNCVRGISLKSATSKGKVENNIVLSGSQYSVSFAAQTAPGDVLVDYNLYWPLNKPFYPSGTHDEHSITNAPQFVSATQSAAADFRLGASSPAINSATVLGLTHDYAGNPIQGAPDMGAFEYQPQVKASLTGNITLSGNARIGQ